MLTPLTGDYLGQVVGLAIHAYDLPLSSLSKGEQFRVELARGLVSGSVVDEFTSNTDRPVRGVGLVRFFRPSESCVPVAFVSVVYRGESVFLLCGLLGGCLGVAWVVKSRRKSTSNFHIFLVHRF